MLFCGNNFRLFCAQKFSPSLFFLQVHKPPQTIFHDLPPENNARISSIMFLTESFLPQTPAVSINRNLPMFIQQ